MVSFIAYKVLLKYLIMRTVTDFYKIRQAIKFRLIVANSK